MSNKAALMKEATEILAKKLNKPKDEVLSEYFKLYRNTNNSSEMLIKDAGLDVPKAGATQNELTETVVPSKSKAKVNSDLTKVVSGVTEEDLPSKVVPTSTGPIGASAPPAASNSPLTGAVNSGSLPKDPIIKTMAAQQPLPNAVGGIKASGKHKGKLIAGGLVAAGAGATMMGKDGEEAPPEPTPAEIAKQVSDKELSSKISNVAKAKSPSDYTAVVASFRAPLEKLGEEEKALFETKLNDLNNKLSEAQGKYEKDKDRTAWSEVAEKVGFALAQIGAGLHGLNTGVDVSGMKFSPTNWEARYDRSLAELKNKEAGIQKGIEQVTEERKERVSSIDKRNETIKRSLFEDYLNTKKINADLQQTQMRLNSDLEVARMNNDTKMIKELEKEREQANKPLEKRLSILQEVKADMQAAGDDELEAGTRDQAKKNLKDNLRKLGKEKLADQISEAADSAKWFGSNYGDESVLKLIDKEIEDTRLLLPQAASSSSGQGTSSGLVYIQAPNGQVAPVQASQVDKYLKKGGKVVAGPGGN